MNAQLEEWFEKGIFYFLKLDKYEIRLFSEGKESIILRVYENGEIVNERRFNKPFWQTDKMMRSFLETIGPYSFDTSGIKTDIIRLWNEYVDYRERPKKSKDDKEEIVYVSMMNEKGNLYE